MIMLDADGSAMATVAHKNSAMSCNHNSLSSRRDVEHSRFEQTPVTIMVASSSEFAGGGQKRNSPKRSENSTESLN